LTRNPYGEDHGKRFAWMPRDVKVTDVARTAYFVGCTSAYRRKEVAVATARLLSKAGVEFTVLGDGEFCCGSPLLRVGDRAAFEDAARHNIDALQRMGIRRVVMSCAGCYSAFKVHYPEVRRFGFKVVHTSQLFSELIREGRLKLSKEVAEVATYHDPCHLGRCAEPRRGWHGVEFKVLTFVRLSVPPRQFRRGTRGSSRAARRHDESPRPQARRDGERAGVRLLLRRRRGREGGVPGVCGIYRRQQAEGGKKTGAGMIVTTCPFCITNFKDGIRESGGGMRCLDLSELLLEATGGRAD
jgi:heterodisulfide reductase subunit D